MTFPPTTSPLQGDSLALLRDRDYTVILARTYPPYPAPPPKDYWQTAYQSVLTLVRHCEALDPDGITLYVSRRGDEGDCSFQRYDHVHSDRLYALIEENYPPSEMRLAMVIPEVLEHYFQRKALGQTKANGEIVLVILDGEPSDRLAISRAIIQATHRLDRDEELGLGFLQIGQDPIAQGFLQALDDHLKENGAKFDIVHTQVLDTLAPECLLQFLVEILSD